GHRLTTKDHDDVTLAAVDRRGGTFDLTVARRGAVAGNRARELLRHRTGFTGRVTQHRGRVAGEPGRARRDLDHRHTEVGSGAAHAEVEDGELVLEIGADEHD